MRAALDELGRAGAKLVPVSLPHTKYAIATYYLVCTAEASSNLARYDGVRYGQRAAGALARGAVRAHARRGLRAEVKRRIMLGTYVLRAGYYDAYYGKALRARRKIADDFSAAFTKCDVIVTPTSPVPAFRFGERMGDPLQMYLADVLTVAPQPGRHARRCRSRAASRRAACRSACRSSGRRSARRSAFASAAPTRRAPSGTSRRPTAGRWAAGASARAASVTAPTSTRS